MEGIARHFYGAAPQKVRHSQCPVWAGHVSYVAVRPRLCKARFLRIAATREHAPHDRCQPFYDIGAQRSIEGV
jgi:hypothetical protein